MVGSERRRKCLPPARLTKPSCIHAPHVAHTNDSHSDALHHGKIGQKRLQTRSIFSNFRAQENVLDEEDVDSLKPTSLSQLTVR